MFRRPLVSVAPFRRETGRLASSTLLPESDDSLRKRTRDCRECASHFIYRDLVISRSYPFIGREITGNILESCPGVAHAHSMYRRRMLHPQIPITLSHEAPRGKIRLL